MYFFGVSYMGNGQAWLYTINMRDIVPKQGGGEAQTLARIMS